MNILYISGGKPGDLSFGGGQRSTFLYNALCQIGSVYCLYDWGVDDVKNERMRKLPNGSIVGWRHYANAIWRRICNMILPPLRTWERYLWFPFARPLAIDRYFPRVKFDCVVTRYYRQAGEFHFWKIAPTFVDVDDHPLQILKTIHFEAMSVLHRIVAKMVTRIAVWFVDRHISGGWVVNQDNQHYYPNRRKKVVLPNIPAWPDVHYTPKCHRSNYLFTVGLMSYLPNVLGVDDFISHIWPEVRKRFPAIKYKVVGKACPLEFYNKWTHVDGVEVLGYVESLDDIYARSIASVVPVLTGAGSCIKTVESMAYSRVCLTTLFGARGVAKSDIDNEKTGLLLYDTASDFCTALASIVADDFRRNVLENRGLEYAKKHFGRDLFSKIVIRTIFSGLKRL